MTPCALSLKKGATTYVFRYAPGCEDEVVDEIMRLAADESSEIDWLDAANLGFQITQNAAANCYRQMRYGMARAKDGPCSNSA